MKYTIYNLEELLTDQAKGAEMSANPARKRRGREWAARKRLSSLELLNALQITLPVEITKLKFDYFTLFSQCIALMKKTWSEIGKDYKELFQPMDVDSEGQLSLFGPNIILVALRINLNDRRLGKDKPVNKLLQKAGDILDEFVEEEGRAALGSGS